MEWLVLLIIVFGFFIFLSIKDKKSEEYKSEDITQSPPFSKRSKTSDIGVSKESYQNYKQKKQTVRQQNYYSAEVSQSMSFNILPLEQGSAEWLEWRHSGIGGSDASAVMGDNRFQSPEELLHQKKNKIYTKPNDKMKLGTELEPKARTLYIKQTGLQVRPLCLQSKNHSWLIASMDGITDDYQNIVEIKCGKSAYWQAHRGIVPDYYYGQLQHQLMITDIDVIDYWCYWPGQRGILIKVDRDEKYINKLFAYEEAFIKRLQV